MSSAGRAKYRSSTPVAMVSGVRSGPIRHAENPPREAYIEAACKRCLDDYRLDPHAPPARDHIGAIPLKRRREAFAPFAQIARAALDRLFAQIADQAAHSRVFLSRYVLMLTDATGTILDVVTDPANAERAAAAAMAPGFIWDERHQGTSGPGTCLHDRCLRVVHREDHFFACNQRLTCVATPVWGANHELLGAIDITRFDCNDSRASQVSTAALARMTARSIEYVYFMGRYRDCLIIHVHERPDFMDLPFGSLLAIDDQGYVCAVESDVPGQFITASQASPVGRSVEDLFDISVDRLFWCAEAQPAGVVPLTYGRDLRGYARLIRARRPSIAPPPQSRSATDQQALAECDVEVAATGTRSLVSLQGTDPAMAENVRRVERIIGRDITILLAGETGTGKDSFARAIHQAAGKPATPFIVLRCAAISQSSCKIDRLRGDAGISTDAWVDYILGKLLEAKGGTLFLDAIGDAPPSVQARILRLLGSEIFVPADAGTTAALGFATTVISATCYDLEALVAKGSFRKDLFYRLTGTTLPIPPLRARTDRAALIAALAREENSGKPIDIDPAAWALLLSYSWPGNIRELRNTLRAGILYANQGHLDVDCLYHIISRKRNHWSGLKPI